MKKLLFLAIGICSVVLMTKNPGDTKSVSPQGEKTGTDKTVFEIPRFMSHGSVAPASQPEVKTTSDFESDYQNLEVAELEKLLDSLESSEDTRQLIALANNGKLTEADKNRIVTLTRFKAALTKLLIEKASSELELL